MTRARERESAGASDADLVMRVRAGEREAYGELVNRHQDSMYRYARGMGLDHDTSLDLMQDAFVKAYTRLSDCEQPAHFRAWAFRIARNLYLDYLKNVRRNTVPLSTVPDAANIPGPQETSDGTLGEALDQLPTSLREAFLLKHDAGYTYEEVAELTNASPSAVKMRVHRARETLRDFLMKRGVRAA